MGHRERGWLVRWAGASEYTCPAQRTNHINRSLRRLIPGAPNVTRLHQAVITQGGYAPPNPAPGWPLEARPGASRYAP